MKTFTVVSICESARGNLYQKDYESMAVRLAKSIRNNGGECSDCDIVFWHDWHYPPSDKTVRKLKLYDCKFVAGETPIKELPLSNKIAACSLHFDTDYTLWMDTDMYVLKDFSALFETDKDILVTPVSYSTSQWAREEDIPLWDEYYNHFGLQRPDTKIRTNVDKKLGNFYFSSGLIGFRSSISFGAAYFMAVQGILATEVADKQDAVTQTAIPILLTKFNLSYQIIPGKYHYVYSVHNHRLEDDDVAIVHYQGDRIKEVSDKAWSIDIDHRWKYTNAEDVWQWYTTFLGQHMQHNYWQHYLLDDIILNNPQIKSIIELGTGTGVVTAVLGLHAARLGARVFSVDVDMDRSKQLWTVFDKLGIEYCSGDVFSDKIISRIESIIDGKPTYIICDNGDKIREFGVWAPKIPVGSVISAHDWGNEIRMNDIEDIVKGHNLKSYKPERWNEMNVQFATFVKK